jgi:hypothetical protein
MKRKVIDTTITDNGHFVQMHEVSGWWPFNRVHKVIIYYRNAHAFAEASNYKEVKWYDMKGGPNNRIEVTDPKLIEQLHNAYLWKRYND